MRSPASILNHRLLGPAVRYVIAGGLVAIVYLGVPLLLNSALGIWIELATAIGYLTAIVLQFNLQRRFVFGHVDAFALSTRQQIGRYAMMAAIQYPTTALAEALLPGLLGVGARIVFVAVTILVSMTFFLTIRGHVFHADGPDETAAVPPAAGDSESAAASVHGSL